MNGAARGLQRLVCEIGVSEWKVIPAKLYINCNESLIKKIYTELKRINF